jgi:hypothetical protein
VFASLFFLQLALVSSSFFLAAVCGTSRQALANFIILVMLVATWIPCIVLNAQSILPWYGQIYDLAPGPRGLFWMNSITSKLTSYDTGFDDYYATGFDDDRLNYTTGIDANGLNYTHITGIDDDRLNNINGRDDDPLNYTTCNNPILSEYQGTFYKTEEERGQVESDELFVGCYIAASHGVKTWNDRNKAGIIVLFFFPYFHFNNIWGNFVGFTSMPGKEFTHKESSLSTEALAIKALPVPPDPDWALASEFAPQLSTFILDSYYPDEYDYRLETCPLSDNHTDLNLCPYLYNCGYAQDPGPVEGSPSTTDMYGFLFALSMLYIAVASYWAQAFPGGNGRALKFYFPFQTSYWLENCRDGSSSAEGASSSGVVVDAVKKVYGSFSALKGVTFKMERGEVTALLGKSVV